MTVANTLTEYDWSKVEAHLDRAGVSKSQLARDLGLDRKVIYNYRNGAAPFTARTALAIAYLLDIDVNDLVADDAP